MASCGHWLVSCGQWPVNTCLSNQSDQSRKEFQFLLIDRYQAKYNDVFHRPLSLLSPGPHPSQFCSVWAVVPRKRRIKGRTRTRIGPSRTRTRRGREIGTGRGKGGRIGEFEGYMKNWKSKRERKKKKKEKKKKQDTKKRGSRRRRSCSHSFDETSTWLSKSRVIHMLSGLT